MRNKDNKLMGEDWRFPSAGLLEWIGQLVGGWRPRVGFLLEVIYWLAVGVGKLVWGVIVLVLILVAVIVCLVASVLPE